MKKNPSEYQRLFQTSRLVIDEVHRSLSPEQQSKLLLRAVEILSPNVVRALPPTFQGISSLDHAKAWFTKMTNESRLLVIKSAENQNPIGFIFLHEDKDNAVHIGYLLSEEEWRKGYAKECLVGLINWCVDLGSISALIGGVKKSNIASVKLLKNIGFVEIESDNTSTDFYQYQLH